MMDESNRQPVPKELRGDGTDGCPHWDAEAERKQALEDLAYKAERLEDAELARHEQAIQARKLSSEHSARAQRINQIMNDRRDRPSPSQIGRSRRGR